MDEGLTPREQSAKNAGFPPDITYSELREELDRAWAIVDRQDKLLDVLIGLVDIGDVELERPEAGRPKEYLAMFTSRGIDAVMLGLPPHISEHREFLDDAILALGESVAKATLK